jgi:uncharacterized protein (DUF736 family)
MTTIGTFSRDEDSFTGSIATLTIKAKAVFKPTAKASDKAPDYRVYAAGAEIGAAWATTSKAENSYLSVKLDDPTFVSPITCRLVEIDGKHLLLWSR